MSRKALIVGIDSYDNFAALPSCARDADDVEARLSRNVDASTNYECLRRPTGRGQRLTRAQLRSALTELFRCTGDVAFYFSGHGAVTESGGWLATSDASEGDLGVSMDEVLALANAAAPRPNDILIILDCCYSGAFGNPGAFGVGQRQLATLRENITVIAASLPNEPALAGVGLSKFTSVVVDALDGGAGDHLGFVTASSIYAYAERRFGAWDQRPIFKSNITEVSIVRRCAPLIELHRLRKLPELFPNPHYQFQLDPGYEPQDEEGSLPLVYDQDKFEKGRLLKEFRNVGLVRATILGEDFYFAAKASHTVELTLRGIEYWYLTSGGKV